MGSQNSRHRISESVYYTANLTHTCPPAPIVFRQDQVHLNLTRPMQKVFYSIPVWFKEENAKHNRDAKELQRRIT